MKKSVCFIFTDPHLSYSPTILNLYDLLEYKFNVTLLAGDSQSFKKVAKRKTVYLDLKSKRSEHRIYRLATFFQRLRGSANSSLDFDSYRLVQRLKFLLKNEKFDLVICVDLYALWLFQQFSSKPVHFLSLELKNEYLLANINKSKIESVFIQREDRFRHLFGDDLILKRFIVQNAPVYKQIELPKSRDCKTILYCGTAVSYFGVYAILNFIKKHKDYKIYFKGAFFESVRIDISKFFIDEFNEGRIIIDELYLDESEMTDFITNFYVGICFYDFSFKEVNNFNYQTAPSGKMFKYFAAGVPVIGIDILGLSYIKDYQAGVLISNLSSVEIESALQAIDKNYESYCRNCMRIAQKFSFENNAAGYIDYLITASS